MEKIKFAIIGPGKIAHSFMNGVNELDNAEVIAVVSRSIERAKEFADKYNIKYYYDNFKTCLENDEVDAVYISTPPFMHYSDAIEALNHNKHVICEKPFTVDYQELKKLLNYAKKRKLIIMEAMKSPFLPLNQRVKKMLDEGEVGEIMAIEGSFTYDGGPRYDHFHFKKSSGGGSLYDVGIYPLAIAMYFVNSEVKKFVGYARNAPTGADCLASVMLQFKNGVIANIRGGLQINTYQGVYVYGSKGKVAIPHFWTGDEAIFEYYDGREKKIIHDDAKNEFKYEVGHFVNLINEGKLESDIMSHDFSLKVMKIMSACVKKWEKE
jgi:predicted dehydrogenase